MMIYYISNLDKNQVHVKKDLIFFKNNYIIIKLKSFGGFMRVLDFDNTIYDGESVVDFYLFSIKYNPCVLKYFFIVL